jgi:hypothetical protein
MIDQVIDRGIVKLRAIYERESILARLANHKAIFCVRPDSIKAALELQTRGQVRCQWGEGADRGILIVAARSGDRRPFVPPSGGLIA